MIESNYSNERGKMKGIHSKMNDHSQNDESNTPLISNQSNSFYKQFNSKRNSGTEETNEYVGTIGPDDDLD